MSGCSCVYIDHGEGPTFHSVETRTAKKQHHCDECHRAISPGGKYERTFGVWDGRHDTYRTCAECASIRDTFFCDGFIYGEVLWHLREHLCDNDGNVSTDCMMSLSPAARARVCDMIQEIWDDKNTDEDEIPGEVGTRGE